MDVRVGIHTDGEPRVERDRRGLTVIANALMGVGFHWQRSYRLTLPADTVLTPVGPDECRQGPKIVARLPMEDYLRSVISSEMNPDAPEEFLKAHAIIARSWLIRQITHVKTAAGLASDSAAGPAESRYIKIYDASAHTGFDVCNDDHCQRFQGMDAITPRADRAVTATRGMVLTDADGAPADCRYAKCCGGHTELFSTCWQDTDFPYLQAKPDPWCDPQRFSPEMRSKLLHDVLKDYDRTTTADDYFRWTRRVDSRHIEESLARLTGRPPGRIDDLIPLTKGPSGRISLLRIAARNYTVDVGKELLIRRLLAADCLLSSAFSVSRAGHDFELSGRGWGHGVGLCQIGAAAMARAGQRAEQILEFYYPGTRLSTLSD